MRFIIMCFCFLLTSCGFQPLYADRDVILEQAASVQIEPVVGESGYQIGLLLQDRLNPKNLDVIKKYRLVITLSRPVTSNQSIRSDNFASLEKMNMKATYQLIDIKTNKAVIASVVDSNGLFNLIKDPYATTIAQENLYQNLVRLMAKDIANHVLAYLKGLKE